MKYHIMLGLVFAATMIGMEAMDVQVASEAPNAPCSKHMRVENMLSLYAQYVRLEMAAVPVWRFQEGEYESLLERRTACERQLEHPCSACHRSPLEILRMADMDMLEEALDEAALIDYRAIEHRLCHFHHPTLDVIRALCDRHQELQQESMNNCICAPGKAGASLRMRMACLAALEKECRHCSKSPLDILGESWEEADSQRLRAFCYLKHTPFTEIVRVCFMLGEAYEQDLPRYFPACQHCGKTALAIFKEGLHVAA